MTSKEYKPFGKEWEENLQQFNKKEIIELYRKVCIRLVKMEELKLY